MTDPLTIPETRPRNRQGRPRKWGDHCSECLREVQMQWMRHGLCAACYQRHRRTGTITTGYVDPAAARAHLAKVHTAGVSYRWIAKQAGTNTVNLNYVAQGRRRRISGELATKILAVPIPATDEPALRQRALQTAGMRGIYAGIQRRYQQDRARRGIGHHKRDPLRHSLRAKYLAEREAFLEWLYEGMPAKTRPPAPKTIPVVREVTWATLACGDCEHRPCQCDDVPPSFDVAWLSQLADHDDIAQAAAADLERVAA